MRNGKKYSIGLDIGVASVGWCVTDEESNILKYNGKNMWGSRIFEEAKTAQERRMYRSSRRRLNRRKERINILQSLLIDDIEKEYPNFLQMLRESANNPEDKKAATSIDGVKYGLFSEADFNDKNYFEKYPTIYHLRNYLVNSTEKADIRLVYLAIHHIIKYRGNFLHDGSFVDNTTEIKEVLDIVIEYLEKCGIILNTDIDTILNILKAKNKTKRDKKDEIIYCFDFFKEDKQIVVNIINSFLGYSFDLNKIFDDEFDKSKITFSKEIENEEEIKATLKDNACIYEAIYTIYSWYILQETLMGKKYISEGFIEKYKKYEEDLKKLKKIYKEYFSDEYSAMFRKIGINNYVAYNGKNSGKLCKKCKPEEFFDVLKKKIAELPDDCEEKEKIKSDLEDNNFLKKINVTDNGSIPHQLHGIELEKILENQSKHYSTIKENKDKIMSLFSFRIPYYVGPLAKNDRMSKWSWVIRKADDKIRPWNFSEVVDEDATAEKFIRKMTNKCTYLINEDVIPKQSLLYSEFCVLNELNNIRVNDKHLSKGMKKKIIETLFMNNKKVTVKKLKEFYKHEGIVVDNISGISDSTNFNSSMSSYIDMVKILGKVDESNYEKCENIIYWITIFEDKKILRRKIENTYKDLSEEQINNLVKLKYTGWSRLSKQLLTGLKSNDNESVMDKLRTSPLNFMQIINEKEFGFDKKLEEYMPKISSNISIKDIDEIPTSPANKRAIWQTVCVVREITKIMKSAPKNIYIEFAREDGIKRVMKDSRAKKLLKIYEDLNEQLSYLRQNNSEIYKQLKQHQSDKELSEKMYLYFLQGGKCLYSGESLDISEFNEYEVDHIMPQSYIKDDSIDNKALVKRIQNQNKKDNLLLSDNIIDKMLPYWEMLFNNGLISQTKFYRLKRRKLFETDADREKFVQRQLVETRQITKYVTNLLLNSYNSSNIYALKSELTSGFRKKYSIYKNRNVNNYHHAQDAYILNVVGNIIDQNWNGNSEFKYSEYVKKYFEDEKSKEEKNGMLMGFINKYVDIVKVKKVIQYKDCYISRMLQEGTGEFYAQTLYSPKDKNKNSLIPLKSKLDVNKYGGYSGENKAYFVIYSYINKKAQTEYQLIGIPIQIAYEIKSGVKNIEEYIKEKDLVNKEYSNFKIIRNKILKNQEYIDEDGELMRLCSDSEIRSNKELIVNEKVSELIYLINCNQDKLDDEQKAKVECGCEVVFSYLKDKLGKEYKCFEKTYEKLLQKDFSKLKFEEKKSTINGLIDLMQNGQGNLTSIGLTSREGRKTGQTFKTRRILNMVFIDKSVTGMYERRFKVDGLENCNCK